MTQPAGTLITFEGGPANGLQLRIMGALPASYYAVGSGKTWSVYSAGRAPARQLVGNRYDRQGTSATYAYNAAGAAAVGSLLA